MKVTKESHTDHLTPEQLAFILERFKGRTAFFIEEVELPPELGKLECGLYGPVMGDPPVTDDEVTYLIRPNRRWASRLLLGKPFRPAQKAVVIGVPTEEHPCVLMTAYGGPLAPQEPGDTDIASWDGVLASRAFWKDHALAVQAMPQKEKTT